ncbi:hypothetical protein BASA81_010500 [Batrachochytrium salamandrivorans]|nr:hypothetical protein BASA81_010500 [Batrachochytrium salamandrivorans]
MVAVSFVLVLALVSSTVIALPGTNGFTGLFSCFKRQPTPTPPKLLTISVHRWIPLDEETPTPPSDQDPADIGLSYILQQLNIQPDEFTKRTNFTDRFGVTHLYGIPPHQGLLIEDLHAAVHIKNGQVFFYSATTILDDHALTKRSPTIPESTVEISSEDAVKAAVDCLGVPLYNAIAPVKKSYKTDNGKILVWVFHLRDNPTTQWIEVKVDANTGVIVSKKDVKRKFIYMAIKLPNENAHDGFSKIVYPENLQASPNGWTDGYKLAGNNVEAIVEGDMTLETTTRGIFKGTFDPTLPPQVSGNLVAGAVNAFYGKYQSMTWMYLGSKCVCPPYWWGTDKNVHVENRALGLSEGYSDVMALIFTAKPEDTRNTEKVIAEYVIGDPQGVRKYPYTTDMRVNPLKYRDAVGEKQRHRLGEIWATMLWEVYWNLVEKYGFSANLHDATQEQGNIIFLQLFVGALMIQPCNPTFVSARRAMLAADAVYYGGIHKHLIRKGFAKRGLGSIS